MNPLLSTTTNTGSAAVDPDAIDLRKVPAMSKYFFTSHEAEQLTGILASTFHSWHRTKGLALIPQQKGERTIYLMDAFNVLRFIVQPEAGQNRIKSTRLPIDDIVVTDNLQYRSTHDEADASALDAAISNGGITQPVSAFDICGLKYLADGRRRLEALKRIGQTWVDAYVLPGDMNLARYYAFRINQTHGLRLGDSARAAVIRFITEDSALFEAVKSDKISHRQFAEHFGFTDSTVYRAYRDLSWKPSKPKPPLDPTEVAFKRKTTGVIEELREGIKSLSPNDRLLYLARGHDQLTSVIAIEQGIAPTAVSALVQDILRGQPPRRLPMIRSPSGSNSVLGSHCLTTCAPDAPSRSRSPRPPTCWPVMPARRLIPQKTHSRVS
jgi:hypothetical protein